MNILDILNIPMGYIFRFAYSLTDNYLIAIFLFTLVMEIILCPIAIKQQKNQIKQARLAPKVAALRKKYAGRTDQATQQKMQQETMELYQSEKASPMGGCLPMLIQFPFIIIIYNVVTSPLRFLCGVGSEAITSVTKYLTEQRDGGVALITELSEKFNITMSNYQQFNIINILKTVPKADLLEIAPKIYEKAPELEGVALPNFHLFGTDLSMTPEIRFSPINWLMIIPVITFIVMVLSTKIMQKFSYRDPMTEDQQNGLSMKIMMYSMPLLSVFIEFSLPSLIGIYWIFRNVVQLIEKFILAKLMPLPKFSQEDYEAAEREANMSNKQKKRAASSADRGDRPFVRSLHYIDDEEYIARHAEDLKALEEEKAARANYRPKLGGNKTTSSEDAPAPIKNDEKTSYEKKNKKSDKKK